ncbi:MAG: peptide deformylase [Phycisphaerae bacterium]|nr:peptide deformylase [Phycisphaerae bacterium]
MSDDGQVVGVDGDRLTLVKYPDPRLRSPCRPVGKVDDDIRTLIDRMFELMFAFRGVGLAGPQVGVSLRLFVASPTFHTDDRQVYINPDIVALDGSQDGEEGCLSFPDIACRVRRYQTATLRALDRDGEPFERAADGLLARIIQHETDHLDGRLLVDRMGSLAKLSHRAALKELEAAYETARH